MGNVVAAVDRYQDIPAPVRAKLKERMQARGYDEMVSINRDSIVGKAQYEPQIREMHFGQGKVCSSVTRTRWTASMQERGLVYCEDGHCILVPTVCRNVSRITRSAPAPAKAAAAAPAGQAPEELLALEPTGAGVPAANLPGDPSFNQVINTPPGVPVVNTPQPLPPTSVPTFSVPPPGVPPLPAGDPPVLPPDPPLPPVPEPGTWAMMLAGLAAMCWLARRRRPARA